MLGYILLVLLVQNLCLGALGIVRVHFDVRSLEGPKKLLSFCVDCSQPEVEGSFVFALIPKFSAYTAANSRKVAIEETISGELIYCVPNLADRDKILNQHEFENRVILVDRGAVPMLDKVKRIQKAGAAGVVIADDGNCNEEFSSCGYRIGSHMEGGFSSHDDVNEWKKIVIPVFLISKSSAVKIKKLMDNQYFDIPGTGRQLVTRLEERDEF